MNTFLFAHATQGVLFILLLFAVCFIGVHLARLVAFGWEYHNQTEPPPEQTPEKKAPEKPSQEQVYYIVERKRRKPKTSYSEPKEIRFQ
ncbi:MAG: hypothetical protein J6A38_01765 [Clostridia bacterium]|nr:hypothetical protein [Clostridia bacterium]